jgi:hypothetical protein
MRKNAEAGQSGGESAGDSVRNSQVEGCNLPFAEPNQEDGSQQDCQKRDERCGDDHAPLAPVTYVSLTD